MDGQPTGGDASWAGSMPETYDRCLGPALFAPFAVRVSAEAAAVVSTPEPVVLELAAGSGIATAELVRTLPAARITATDLNPAMVAHGAANVPGPVWRTADAQQLDFAAGEFDLVVCQFGVMFFPDKPAAFAQAARVLAPGATLLFTSWDRVGATTFAAALTAALAVACPDDPPDFVARIPHGYADVARIERDVTAGGLRLDSVERVVLRGRSPSARTVAEGFCQGTPLRFALQARGDLTELTGAVGAAMTAELGEGPVAGDLTAFVIRAHKS